ncbi:outer membrane lipoprotein-sorting protein [Microbulbifer thermotolerans]|uniref:outer membrane lipoprotein-sorting protein n=1 Tax=Microbulbifer thermotolerans TaxID=252514 RepID=UPI00267213E7|nr:outer membrane lipoprotein-sorting protein [Microbulbifer thermotolerans]WKT60917.1 outer membrane lipoprotein-sorting protein [Microbulbifer thermotolerans]
MWSMAFRNLYRDRRRTLATIIAVSAGLFAVLMFLGYIRFVESSLASVVIYRDANAHVQVYRKDGPEQLAASPAQYSLDSAEQALIHRTAAELTHFVRASNQLMGVGMAQADSESAVFLARGVEPEFETALQQHSPLAASPPPRNGLLLTTQLQDLLGRPDKGSYLQLFGASYANRMNAIEAPLTGDFSTGIEAIEDKGLKAPLDLLQSLYDTDAVSRVVIQLDDRVHSGAFRNQLAAALERQQPGRFEVTTWDHPQIGQLYTSFMGFFTMVFAFTGIVVFTIALTTIQHTVAMNVADRTREIGILRSLGFSRGRIAGLFVRESLLTTLAAALVATALAYTVIAALALIGVQTQLPRIAEPTALTLQLPPTWAIGAIACACAGITLGALLTARKRVGGEVLPGRRGVPLTRMLASAACLLLALPLTAPAEEVPDEETMRNWLKQADLARGGWGSYMWKLSIHTEDPAGATDTDYDIAVRNGRALAMTTAPRRYRGEKILIASRAMWYAKPGLRKPISISPQQRLVGEAANGDIAATQYARDYTPEYLGPVELDGIPCHKLKLTAATDSATYEAIIYYLDRRSRLGVRAEFLTASGMPLKVAHFEYGNRVQINGEARLFVSRMKIVNANFPERYSLLQYDQVIPADPPESLFSVDTLMTL